MAKTWLLVLLAIVAIVIGAVMFYLWGDLRPEDDELTKWGVAIATGLAGFTSLYFMTKSGGEG